MNTSYYLSLALRAAGVAIDGVSVGDPADRSTWKVTPPSLQAAAQPVIDAFVMPSAAQMADDTAQRDTNRKEIQALAVALWECIPAPTMTKLQLKNRIVAIYKTL